MTTNKNKEQTEMWFRYLRDQICKSFEEIENRMKETLKFISKEQLIVAPDCGLGHLSRELAIKKLKIMSLAAKKFK